MIRKNACRWNLLPKGLESRRLASLALALILLTVAAGGLQAEEILTSGGSARVTEIIDGDTVVLDDGRQVRLVGIQAPKLPLGRPNFEKWPLADQAKRVLEGMASGRMVELRSGGEKIDRHGRTLSHLFLENGQWLQGEMLSLGLARVYTFPDNRKLAADMYALERAARMAGRGIWDHPFYGVRAPSKTYGHLGTFQVVEGRVVDAAKVKGTVYLNFGADWRKDFTVTIRPKALRMFLKAGVEPLSFKNQTVRVRGWLKSYNGPMIEATHPEQVEIP